MSYSRNGLSILVKNDSPASRNRSARVVQVNDAGVFDACVPEKENPYITGGVKQETTPLGTVFSCSGTFQTALSSVYDPRIDHPLQAPVYFEFDGSALQHLTRHEGEGRLMRSAVRKNSLLDEEDEDAEYSAVQMRLPARAPKPRASPRQNAAPPPPPQAARERAPRKTPSAPFLSVPKPHPYAAAQQSYYPADDYAPRLPPVRPPVVVTPENIASYRGQTNLRDDVYNVDQTHLENYRANVRGLSPDASAAHGMHLEATKKGDLKRSASLGSSMALPKPADSKTSSGNSGGKLRNLLKKRK